MNCWYKGDSIFCGFSFQSTSKSWALQKKSNKSVYDKQLAVMPELIPVSVAWSDWEYSIPPAWDASPLPIYSSGWREALWEWSPRPGLQSGLLVPGADPGRRHCVVCLSLPRCIYSYSILANWMLVVTLQQTSIPSRGGKNRNIFSRFMLQKPE